MKKEWREPTITRITAEELKKYIEANAASINCRHFNAR